MVSQKSYMTILGFLRQVTQNSVIERVVCASGPQNDFFPFLLTPPGGHWRGRRWKQGQRHKVHWKKRVRDPLSSLMPTSHASLSKTQPWGLPGAQAHHLWRRDSSAFGGWGHLRPRRTGITSLRRFLNFPTHVPMLLHRTELGPWQVRDYRIHGGDVINHVIPEAQNVKWLSQDHTQESGVRAGTHICFLQTSLPQRQSQPLPTLRFYLMYLHVNGPFWSFFLECSFPSKWSLQVPQLCKFSGKISFAWYI